ncbi:MAG: response regulator, partial [Chloroflexi bacterium]
MPYRILVIDDEPHMARLASYVLQTAGYDVLTAEDGRDGLEKLAHFKPDLVVCDITMPEMDGFEVVRTLRADPRWRHLPVIMLTARGQEQDVQRAQEVGANSYLTKPFSSRHLLG